MSADAGQIVPESHPFVESGEQFRLMADAIPQIVWVTDDEGRARFFNRQWYEYVGWVRADQLTTFEVAARFVHPDDQEATLDAFDKARAEGTVFAVEHRIRAADGQYRWFLARALPYRDPDTGRIVRWFGSSTDIHDRTIAAEALRASEVRQAFLLTLSDAIRHLRDPEGVKAVACRVLAGQVRANRVLYTEVEGDSWIVECGHAAGVQPLAPGNYPAATYGQRIMDSYRAGQRVVFHDTRTDSLFTPAERKAHIDVNVLAAVGIPLIKEGNLVAILAVHSSSARDWTDNEIALIEHTAEHTWAAVERARAEAAVKASESKYRMLFDSIDEGFCIIRVLFDGDGKPYDYVFLETNSAFDKHTGLQHPVGRSARELVPDLDAQWFERYGRVALTGEPARFQQYAEAMGRHFDVFAFRTTAPDQCCVALLFSDITARHESAEALRHSEARARALVENLPGGAAFVVNQKLQCEMVGGEALAAFGLKREDFLGRYLSDVGPGEPAEEQVRSLREVLAGESFSREHEAYGRVFASRGVPLRDANGAVSAALIVFFDITELRRAEELSRKNEARLSAALDVAQLGAFEWNVITETVTLDTRSREIFGFSSNEEIAAAEVFLRIHPDDLSRVVAAIQTSREHLSHLEIKYRVLLPDAVERTVVSISHAIPGSDGQVERMVGVFSDITETERAASALEAAERRSHTILDSISDGFLSLGRDWRFIFLNRAAHEILNRRPDELIGISLWDAYPGIIGTPFETVYRRVMDTGEPESIVAYYPDHDRYYDVMVYPFSEGISMYFRNVTEKKRAEEIQRKTEQALRESEAQYRVLTESMPQLVWTCLPDGRCDYLSSQWVAYTGIPEEEQLDLQWLGRVIHPDDRERTREHWLGAVAGRHPYDIEYRIRAADGTYRWFQTRGVPLRDTKGVIVKWYGTCTDVHDRKKAEEELRHANRHLEEFAYVASHDLQEPLRVVNAYTELLLRRNLSNDASARQFGEYIQQGVSRMETLIRDLLTFSRTIQQSQDRADGRADLSQALAEAMAVLKDRIHENEADIEAGQLPVVAGDEQKLALVFQNLLSNALKYRQRDVRPRIRVSARRGDRQWIISVEDNGIGFEQEYAERIFGLFKRLHSTEYPGTGLGLAICQRLIEGHGGQIWAESKPGLGSTFHFSLRER